MIHLASQSPRRRELLEQIAVPYRVVSVEVDESALSGEAPAAYVARLAAAKAQAGAAAIAPAEDPTVTVLGADTAVVLGGRILGKPDDEAHARDMLRALSGQTHQVMSAVCLLRQEKELTRLSVTEVSFRPLNDQVIARYWRTGEGRDKAGAYGIQGLAAVFVERIAGSYSGVVGLPLEVLAPMLEELGLSYWESRISRD